VLIHLQAAADTARQPGRAAVYIFVTGADALYEELQARGVRVLREPRDYPYGMRDFAITDLDGNSLAFGMEDGPGGAGVGTP
jgi:predicted enzyme related to lactoylglutathione lyase